MSQEIKAAVSALMAGRLVAFPTETVYGLGADAENAHAVAQIYALKGRPSTHPLIVHLAPAADIHDWAAEVPEAAEKLIAAFWPGPLTLILKRAGRVSDSLTGGQDSIGLRCPSHPVAQALLMAFRNGKGGIAAPSANRFGHVSPTRASHVISEFGKDERLALVLEGGQSEVGIESTILDLSRMDSHGPVLLRPGQVSAGEIERVIGMRPRQPDQQAPRVSGSLASHYAPGKPLVLVENESLHVVLRELEQAGRRSALMHYSAVDLPADYVVHFKMPGSVDAYSHALYATLREMDEADVDVIVVEKTPDDVIWQGVNDRLNRAAHGSAVLMAALLKA